MKVKETFTKTKDGFGGIVKDNKKSTIAIIAGVAIIFCLVIIGAVLDDSDTEEKKSTYIEAQDDTVTQTQSEEKQEQEKNIQTLKSNAWVRDLKDGTKEYLVFEPDGFNKNDGEMAHVYIEDPSKTLRQRYYGDCMYEIEFEEDIIYMTFSYGEGTGDRNEYYSLSDGKLTIGDYTYTAIPFSDLVHMSFTYGTGADEGDNFVEE